MKTYKSTLQALKDAIISINESVNKGIVFVVKAKDFEFPKRTIVCSSGEKAVINWGDDSESTVITETQLFPGHSYASAGEYVITITGSFSGLIGSGSPTVQITNIIQVLSLDPEKPGFSVKYLFRRCTNLVSASAFGNNITDATSCYGDCTSLTTAQAWGSNITNASWCYYGCTSLTNAPEWSNNITDASWCYCGCTSLTKAPVFGDSITDASCCYFGCISLTNVPAWGANITNADGCYHECSGIIDISAIEANPMPVHITSYAGCVTNASSKLRALFTADWGGTKAA